MSKKIKHIHVRELLEDDEKMLQDLMNVLGHKTASKTVIEAVRVTHSLLSSKEKLDELFNQLAIEDLFTQLSETRKKLHELIENSNM